MRKIAFLAVMAAVGIAQAEPKKLVPEREWTGVVNGEKLADAAPKSGLITDPATLQKVWSAWRKDEKVPAIDFKKQFVAVTLSRGGPNRPRINATLEEGTLTILAISTRIGGDAFGYSLAVFPREGVKRVGGVKLP